MAPSRKREPFCSKDEQLIRDHIPLVKTIARRLYRRLPPSVNQDDILGAGALGLLDSIARRNTTSDQRSFECYTKIRIRGAIFDELRSHDWLPRRSRSSEQKKQKGEPAPVAVVHFDDLPAGPDRTPQEKCKDANPLEALSRKRTASMIQHELAQLPPRDRLVVHLHYFKGMRLKEIGRLLGVSEARISQIHHRVLAQLKPRMRSAA